MSAFESARVETPAHPVVISPRKNVEQQFDFQPFNPSSVSPEDFSALPGEIQEFTLKHLIKVSDVNSLTRIRGDMQWNREPSQYEIDLTRAIDDITKRDEPIDGLQNDSLFAYIKTYVYRSEPDLATKLESERVRRSEKPDFLFYSWESIGGYEPAVRYRILLEGKAKQEVEEEKIIVEMAIQEEERRREYDENEARKERERIALVRAELTTIKGGLSERVA